MKKRSALMAIVIGYLFVMNISPVSAQKLEWGLMAGPTLTKPVNAGYSIYGLIEEKDENQVNAFYSIFLKREIIKRWHAELQLGVADYSYTTESFYEPTQFVQYSQITNSYRYIELMLNNHYVFTFGKHELSALFGFGFGKITRSTSHFVQHLDNQNIISATYDFKGEEKVNFAYQLGLQYGYSFNSFKLMVRPFYKRFKEEQYVIPPKKLTAFGVGLGVQF